MESNITVIIPVKNEIIHIERCVKSALYLTPFVFVVDSLSTDGTIEKAELLGARVFQYEYKASNTFSDKMNWSLENLPIETKWVIRLDADEYFLENTIVKLSKELDNLNPIVNGVTLNRRIFFQRRWIKHGGQYPREALRVTRFGFAKYESRWLDEKVIVDRNTIVNLSLDFVDDNLNSISHWLKKHDQYAIREAIEMLNVEIGLIPGRKLTYEKSAAKIRTMKLIYSKLPAFWRAFFYFVYRHFIKLGFLDGYEGFLWNFLQGWVYRTLVDIKINEIKKFCKNDKDKIRKYLFEKYAIQI